GVVGPAAGGVARPPPGAAGARHDPKDLHGLVVELDSAMRRLTDPAGGLTLRNHIKHRAEALFADAPAGSGRMARGESDHDGGPGNQPFSATRKARQTTTV
ncbi:hypothetical protein ACFYXP_29285, partial [Streptomyces sp. NPDC002466]|uniref:hypothetical protein n=1 Tax=Streptomyces sp. NPDC002466 TaxID=3364646 RepID=UPI0036774F7A